MRRFLLLAALLGTVAAASAQSTDSVFRPSKLRWKVGGTLTVMGAQTGTRNWTSAPEDYSLTGVGALYLYANKTWNNNTWESTGEAVYALSNTKTAGIRKLDDKIELFSRYSRWIASNPKLGVGLLGNLRTQFSSGFDYDEPLRKRVSGFFAPAFITIGATANWRPSSDLTISLGPAVRWTVVTNNPYSLRYQGGITPEGTMERTLTSIYNVDPAKNSRLDAGALLSASFNKEVLRNVRWRSRVDFLSDFNNASTPVVDVYFTNNITMSVNKWLKVNYLFDLNYDRDIRYFGSQKNESGVQLKSILGVGLAAGF